MSMIVFKKSNFESNALDLLKVTITAAKAILKTMENIMTKKVAMKVNIIMILKPERQRWKSNKTVMMRHPVSNCRVS